MGISAELWGKEAWRFIHYVALNYPDQPTEKEKEPYIAFLKSIPDILPCPICGIHFADNMKKYPPKMNSRKEFFEWTVDIHNEVNKSNNKKVLSYEEALHELSKSTNPLDINQKIINSLELSYLQRKMKSIKNYK
jgi:hypothetical protein